MHPLQLKVETQGVKVNSIQVDFVGIGMEMGYNRSKLEKRDNNFIGKVILPACIRAKMEWKAKVLLTTDTGITMIPFVFYTIKEGG